MNYPLLIFYRTYRPQFLLETTPFQSTLVSSQVRTETPSLVEATPRSLGDASTRKISSKRQPIASEAPSKFFFHLISNYILQIDSRPTREHSTKQDQTSSEDTARPLCSPLIHALTRSGPHLSERLISSQTLEQNQMPTLNFLCKKLNMITILT